MTHTTTKKGRPRRARQAATEAVNIRLTPDERKRLEARAFQQGYTLSGYIRMLLGLEG